MSDSALVVLSGGQDSTTCLFWAKAKFPKVHTVSFFYGQKHVAELDAAKAIAEQAAVQWTKLPLDVLSAIGDSALTNPMQQLKAEGGRPDEAMPQGLPTSFVPGRNVLFLSAAAALAVKLGIKDIVTGVCQTDYSGYPDCRRDFIDSLEKTLTLAMPSSSGPIVIHTPLMTLNKAQTVHMAKELPGCWSALKLSVTCYEGKRPGCGKCPACTLRSKGFSEAGEIDPVLI